MYQFKKRTTSDKSLVKEPASKLMRKTPKISRTSFIIASVVIILILAIVGAAYYFSDDAKYYRTNIITVDGNTVNMDYFLTRARLSGTDAFAMLEWLVNEEVIKIMAPQYGIEVSPEDIDEALRLSASGGTGNITESEFNEWYRQRLNEAQISNAEYREITRAALLASRLQEYLADRVPNVGEQAHIHIITVDTYEKAEEIRARWEDGEKFTDLAREVSKEGGGEEDDGDIGWYPQGVLMPALDYVAFDLEVGQMSEPQLYADDSQPDLQIYYLLMVSEKADARVIDEENLQIVKAQALQTWLSEEMQNHEIKLKFNSEINAWINWQLSKSQPAQQ